MTTFCLCNSILTLLLSLSCLFTVATSQTTLVDSITKSSTEKKEENEAKFHHVPVSDTTYTNPYEYPRELANKIIGGTQVNAGEYPWFARATIYNHQYWGGCGGMLVAPEFVLTAAHCIDSEFINNGGYMIGALCAPYTNSNNCGQSPVQRISVKKIYKHPQYASKTNNNDFALVRLSASSSITPVPMDQGNFSPKYSVGKELWTIGFGNTLTSGQNFPNHLRHVLVNYITNADCQNKYKQQETITNSMMCASRNGKDSCQGDSGGPLYDKQNNVMVGVVSWGYNCADSRYPGVYARISSQWSWIKKTICDNHSSSTKPNFCGGTSPTPPSPTPPSPTPPSPTPPSPTPPSPTPPSPTPPSPTPPTTSKKLVIQVKTDNWGSLDNWWVLKKKNEWGKFPVVKKRYWMFDNYLHTDSYNFPSDSCFQFIMYDDFADGITGNGYFKVTWGGQVIMKSQMIGKSKVVKKFGKCWK